MTLRRSLGPLPDAQVELVDLAEATGAHATFAGSGGAIVGTYDGDDHFEALADAFADIGADLIKLAPISGPGPGSGTTNAIGEPDHSGTEASSPRGNVVTLGRGDR
jgi:hypothetical protein